MTKHMNAIRLLLQIKSTRLFIGERDKTAEGAATMLKRQGKAGRVEIHTNQGQHCVWRLPEKIVSELLTLWSKLKIKLPQLIVGICATPSDSSLDKLSSLVRIALTYPSASYMTMLGDANGNWLAVRWSLS